MNNLVRQLRYWAEKTPHAVSVSDENGIISFKELDELTDYAAAWLLKKGIKQEDFVTVYVDRHITVIVGAIASMKAGGAYLPIDSDYPKERIRYMVEDSGCHFVLTEKQLWSDNPIPDFGGDIFFLDEMTDCTLAEKEKKLLRLSDENIMPEGSAMLLYTSGTTGNPKGVVHSHASLLATIGTLSFDREPLSQASRFAVFPNFTFMASALSMFSALYHGGSAYIIGEALRKDMDCLHRYLKKSGITHMFLPPSLGIVLAEKYDLQGLTLLLGGEKLGAVNPVSKCNIYNIYGSTEGALFSWYLIKGNENEIPLGLPTNGTEVKILNDQMTQVKTGEVGELFYSSPMMAKEYLHLPEMTQEKWIFLDGKRYFRMGDRVRQDASGLIYYAGRNDDMIKLRGYRIELMEIENQIVYAGGKHFACAVREVRGCDKLCCFYEHSSGFDVKQIQEQIKKKLAPYMLPELWIALEKLPRNPNGKIVRRDLPVPKIQQTKYIAPENDVDAMIVKHMEELLSIPKIGMRDSFVALGGDSVRAMSLSSRLRKRGIILASSDILQAETVSDLCALAKVQYEKIWYEDEWEKVKKEFSERGEKIQKVLPLSRQQEAMLMKQLLFPDNPDHVKFYSFLVDCWVEEDKLRHALDVVSEKFECLRAAVIYHNVSAIQQVITDRKLPLDICRAGTYVQAQEMAEYFYEDNGPFSFDLQENAQLRMRCIQLQNGQSLMLFAVQRFLLDDKRLRWYFSEIFGELAKEYPQSEEIPAWIELLSMGITDDDRILRSDEADGSFFSALSEHAADHAQLSKKPISPVYTYSRIEGAKKFVFFHTANTGSEAYYNLAKRIANTYSFAAVEQYNIYHPGEEVYGIKNLAKKYLEILKAYQPNGPYNLGGWCYGGILAYEVACLLESAGETVEHLVMLDAQAAVSRKMKRLSRETQKLVKREYFETCPLFEDMRTKGMLENLIYNYKYLSRDIVEYVPSKYNGKVLYFKPAIVPKDASGASLAYNQAILAKKAGGYEDFIKPENLEIIITPHEHDLMMDDVSLDVIAPKILELEIKRMSFPAKLSGVYELKSYIMEQEGITRQSRLNICLIAEEIMVNIISYAYSDQAADHTVEVTFDLQGDICRMTFADEGIMFNQQIDPDSYRDYDPLVRGGGAGRLMISRLADSTFYERKDGKNVFGFNMSVELQEGKSDENREN